MEVYILIVFFLILFEFLTMNSNTKTKYRLLLATTIILILVQGLRSFSIGVDLKTYQIIFDRNSAMSFSEIFAYYDAEWGYHLLNKIIFVFGGNLRTLLFIVSISIYIPLYLVVKKYSKMPFISYLLFMFLGLFTFSLSGLRQTMAMGITILAFMQIKDKNLIKFIILVTFATLFHKSALIFYFAYPLYHFRISRKRLYLLIIPMIIIFIFRENIITFLTAIYDSNYQIVDTGAYNFLLLLIFLLIGSVLLLVKKYGLDAIRYFLLREVPFGSDGLFSNEALIGRINADLANDLGNLVSRTVAMIDKYFDGIIPDERAEGDFDQDLMETVLAAPAKVDEKMDSLEFSAALVEIWKAISRTNKYIDETAPWLLAKDESQKPRLAQVMYNLAESIRIVSVLIQPFMVETPEKIWEQLGILDAKETQWDSVYSWGGYQSGNRVQKGVVLFPRIDLEQEMEDLSKLETGKDLSKQKKAGKKTDHQEKEEKKEQEDSLITIDDFAKIQFRTVTVIEAEKVEGADKLLKLKVRMGDEVRQVVSGIAKYYTPEEIIGKNLILVANLKPVKLRGIESQGMILAASDDNTLSLVTLDKALQSGLKVT